jgi:hypothetical protein
VLPLLIMPGSGFQSRPCYSTWHPTSTSRVPSLHRSSWCAMSCGVSPRGPIRERVEATIRMTRAMHGSRAITGPRQFVISDTWHGWVWHPPPERQALCGRVPTDASRWRSPCPSARVLRHRDTCSRDSPPHWTIVIDSAALFSMCWPRSQRLSPTRGSTVSRAPGSADSAPSSALKSRLCARKDCRPSACSSR